MSASASRPVAIQGSVVVLSAENYTGRSGLGVEVEVGVVEGELSSLEVRESLGEAMQSLLALQKHHSYLLGCIYSGKWFRCLITR
jgi:hypothetical protein